MLTLKNIKFYNQLSEETTAFTATLYWQGTKVGSVENTGKGGCNRYNFEKQEHEIKEWAKQQPTKYNFEKLDQLIQKQLCDFEEQSQLKKWCKKNVVFQEKNSLPGHWTKIGMKGGWKPEYSKYIRDKYPDVTIIANEMFSTS